MENWAWNTKNASWLQQYGFLPTQKNIGSDPYPIQLNQSILYYDRMISMIPLGLSRPSAAEYPQIDDHMSKARPDLFWP
jgi:hypothetical protein